MSTSQENAVEVTLTAEGAAVLAELTSQAVQVGGNSRLLLMAADELLSAVVVMEPLDSTQLTIALAPEDDPQKVVDLVRGG